MNRTTKHIFYITAFLVSLVLGGQRALADTADLASALNNSLQESRELNQNLSRSPSSEPAEAPAVSTPNGKTQINFDFEESDTKSTANYKDITEIVEHQLKN